MLKMRSSLKILGVFAGGFLLGNQFRLRTANILLDSQMRKRNIRGVLLAVHLGGDPNREVKVSTEDDRPTEKKMHTFSLTHTPLTLSAYQGNAVAVLELFNSGAVLDKRLSDGSTALHFSVESSYECTRQLLELGAYSHVRNLDDKTPSELAFYHCSDTYKLIAGRVHDFPCIR